MTKKLIRIELAENLKTGYEGKLGEGSLYFAFAGPNEERTKKNLKQRTQMSKFVTCREFLCGVPRSIIHEIESDETEVGCNVLDFTSLRLLIGASIKSDFNTVKSKIFSAKRALNLLEEAAGWDLSVITTVKHNTYPESHVWLLTGDSRWMVAPQMISIVGLVMRLGWRYDLETESLEELMSNFSEFAKTAEDSSHRDKEYIGTCRNHIVPLMQNLYKVFDRKSYANFPSKEGKGWLGFGGIHSLVKCATGDDELNNRLKL